MSESPISLRDEAGVERFRGTQSPAGGGGSQPTTGSYGGNPVLVSDAALGTLTIDSFSAGTGQADLLDFSTPAAPAFKAAGTYAVTAYVAGDALTPGGSMFASLNFDAAAVFPAQSGGVAQSSTTPDLGVALSPLVVIPAGSEAFTVTVFSRDGAAARSYFVTLLVVKIA